ncbi:MAG: alkaline phosphatase family protein [Novosphingobium sp.]|nr:alkaline phosphatase family protein [Novosphingobium sp.]
MSSPVIAIGLDALPPTLLEQWIDQGELPFLARMMSEGSYARQKNFGLYRTENSWLNLLLGCSPETSHEWGHSDYQAGEYRMIENAACSFGRFPPFYALREKKRVAVFDIPLTCLADDVNGVQLLGWGTEVNQILRQSSPPGMMDDLIRRHGRHPVYDTLKVTAEGEETLSYRMPCAYDLENLRSVRDNLLDAVRQRTAIIRELMLAERWDLLLCAYAEIHTAGHIFWHIGRDHLLADRYRDAAGSDFMLDVMREIDTCLGGLLKDAPENTQIVLFSPHGMQANSLDLNLIIFLPEILYRWNTGKAAFRGMDSSGPVPEPHVRYTRHWSDEVRDLRTEHGREILNPPLLDANDGDPLDWDPSHWFEPLWPTLKAFKLPGYSEGLVRLNVRGRDGPEGIPPEDFAATCDELTEVFEALVDARTGDKLIDRVIRVRAPPFDGSEGLSPADLIVVWRDDICTDTIEHPTLGRVGPVPLFRTGGHSTEGFMLGKGSAFGNACRMPDITMTDVTATLLDLLDVEMPSHIDGRSVARTFA